MLSTSNPKLMSDTLISFLEGFEPVNEVQTLLRNIVLLQAKLDSEQDAFVQQTKDVQTEFLNLSKEKYALLVEVVNDGSLEQFNSHIQRIRDEIKRFTSEHEMNSIIGQKVNSLNGQLEAAKSFKAAKEKYGTLKILDELLTDEATLMQIFS